MLIKTIKYLHLFLAASIFLYGLLLINGLGVMAILLAAFGLIFLIHAAGALKDYLPAIWLSVAFTVLVAVISSAWSYTAMLAAVNVPDEYKELQGKPLEAADLPPEVRRDLESALADERRIRPKFDYAPLSGVVSTSIVSLGLLVLYGFGWKWVRSGKS